MEKLRFKEARVSEYILLALAALLCVIKHVLVTTLPVVAAHTTTDDLLMVQMAEDLLRGNWLGAYSPVILMKGIFFPVFLAASYRFGSSYLSSLDCMNTLACFYFVWQMRHLFRDRRLLFPLFVVLLFEPCTYSARTFQRVYRTVLTGQQVLFLFGSYFGLYLRGKEHRQSGNWQQPWRDLLLALVAGITLWAMWNTREESFWVIPFVSVASILILIDLIGALRVQKHALKLIGIRIFCCLLPFLILFGGNQWIRWQNERHYGVALRLEEVDGEFGKTVKTIYSIKNEVDLPYVTVSREKLERLYAASEALRSIRPELDKNMDRFSSSDRIRDDGEIEDVQFFWGLKRAAYENGIADTLQKSQQFWRQVRLELETAISSPDSGFELQPVMPSALMSPWQPSNMSHVSETCSDGIKYLLHYMDVGPSFDPEKAAPAATARRFEFITNNVTYYLEDQAPLDESRHFSLVAPVFGSLKWIIAVYQRLNPILALVSAAAFVFFTAVCALKKLAVHVPFILIVLGMALSAFVMFCGAVYHDISAIPSVNKYYYMTGIYPLMIACECLTLLYLLIVFCRNGARGVPQKTAKENATPDGLFFPIIPDLLSSPRSLSSAICCPVP